MSAGYAAGRSPLVKTGSPTWMGARVADQIDHRCGRADRDDEAGQPGSGYHGLTRPDAAGRALVDLDFLVEVGRRALDDPGRDGRDVPQIRDVLEAEQLLVLLYED